MSLRGKRACHIGLGFNSQTSEVDREKRKGSHRPRTSENQAWISYDLKNYGLDLGGCYPLRPNETLLDLHNSLDDAQPHSIIVKFYQGRKAKNSFLWNQTPLLWPISETTDVLKAAHSTPLTLVTSNAFFNHKTDKSWELVFIFK